MKSKKCITAGCRNPQTTLWSPDASLKPVYLCDKHLHEMKELKATIDEGLSLLEDIE
jgi:hypothetical protein